MAKNKHLTNAERLEIEHGLRHGLSLKKIAAKIGKHHSTVAREIRARCVDSDKSAYGRIANRCASRLSCDRRQLCADRPDCVRRCSACRLCNSVCRGFVEQVCPKLAAAPYVCNGCGDERNCVLRKRYYLHNPAHADYRGILVGAREGANITQGELLALDGLVSPLVKGGQSVHHVLANNPDLFSVNEKTVYRYIAGGLLSAKNGDMPRVCSLKPRARKPVEHKVDTKCRIGRTYADYQVFMAAAPDTRVVEMDSVIGRVGGKVLLTLLFRDCGLMLAPSCATATTRSPSSTPSRSSGNWPAPTSSGACSPSCSRTTVPSSATRSRWRTPPTASRGRVCSTATPAPPGRRAASSATTSSSASSCQRERLSTGSLRPASPRCSRTSTATHGPRSTTGRPSTCSSSPMAMPCSPNSASAGYPPTRSS